ncbi:TonB-dependent receptor [Thiococcus pfennigii]|uniref:TonB-dependent receptor n=1 Tax=Thiococcus pfennigii TaxID=1057 RepID=UPI00190340B8|nr:TonB-dependent receptor [Thiococcus pfennigii]MBK1732577.1 TonB-dependent receptor [Thiococcus pfennigii]
MKRPLPRPLLSAAVLAAVQGLATADTTSDPYTLDTVTVYGETDKPGRAPITTDPTTASTSYQLDAEAIEWLGAPGRVNPYRVLEEVPSVLVADPDPYGAANIQGGNKGLRIRGEIASHGGMGSIEGLPLTGINPGPGYQWLFDMENISQVSLTQGPIPPDRLAFFTTTGVLDSRLRWPEAERGGQFTQSFGSFDFRRSFLRLDSGQLAGDLSFFASASYTDADKWRGPGKALDGRENFEGGIAASFGNDTEAKLYFSYNDMSQHAYRPLDYEQARNLSDFRDYDYAKRSSPTPSEAVNYYDYNRQAFIDWAIIGELQTRLGAATTLTVKPFYVNEEGSYYSGMKNGKVRQWLIDHDWYGVNAEVETRIRTTDVKLGYWVNTMEPPGPPTAWKLYDTTASGGLVFSNWSLLAEPTDRHAFESFYALATHAFGKLRVQGGARYVIEQLSGFKAYDTTGIGDVSYETALEQASAVVPERSTDGTTFYKLLPYLGLSYALAPAAELRLSLGRNYGAPAYSIWPTFQSNFAKFKAAGVTADDIWNGIKPETGDAVDLGLRLTFPRGYLAPTIYYAKYKDKGVAYWDPVVKLAYSQNVAESHAYGVQLAGAWAARRDLDLFASVSWDRSVFDDDLVTAGGATLEVEGEQLPGTPKWLASLGGRWHLGRFGVAPTARYVGETYADSQRTERVPGYATVDLDLTYEERSPLGDLTATLSFINLLDKAYIAYVNASYVEDTGGFNYYPGAPFTVVAKVTLDF